MDTNNGLEPTEKVGVLLKIPKQKKQDFEDLYPWHGSLSQFFLQSLDEFLELSKGQKSPAQLTTEAVKNVFRTGY